MLQRRKASQGGFTLLEMVIASVILIVGILAVVLCLHASVMLTRATREKNVAMFKVQTVLEQIVSTPFTQITTRFPNGQPIDIAGMLDTNPANNLRLNDENLVVTYADPGGDPLVIAVTINWTDFRLRARTITMWTIRSR